MILRNQTALLCATTAAALLAGCERAAIRVYTAPKDTAPQPAAAEQRARPAQEKVVWGVLPPDWTEAENDRMSVARFEMPKGAGQAFVTITPMAGLAGREPELVDMWRASVGLEPLPQGEAAKVLKPAEAGGAQGQMFDVEGTNEGKPVSIVTVMVNRGDAMWFYKLQGEKAAVDSQRAAFLDFVKSVKLGGPAPEPAATAAAPAEEPQQKFNWAVPAGWQSTAAGLMQAAKFSVPEKDGAKAEVMVSIFPSDTGGLAANIKRWRGQIALPDVDDATAVQAAKPLEGAPQGAQIIELKNEKRALLGAVVPRSDRWFFYKMLGDAAAVEAQREAFVAFVKSQP